MLLPLILCGLFVSSYAYFPSPVYQQVVYVNQSYGGTPQNGAILTPFVTITQALTSILDSSPTNRYAIFIETGTYTEPTLHIIADVFLVGNSDNTMNVVIDSDFDINDPSWTVLSNNTHHASGLYGVYLMPTHNNTIEFVANKSDFFLYDVTTDNVLTISSAYDNTRTFTANSLFNYLVNVYGTSTTVSNAFFNGPGVNVYSSPYFSQFIATGGFVTGNLNATWTSPDAPLQLLLPRFGMNGIVTLSGENCNATVNRYFLNGESLFLQDGASAYYFE
jgi:hypothetical protein